MAEIPLTQNMTTLIDDDDLERVQHHKWWAHWRRRAFYATANVDGKIVHLSHFILGVSDVLVDHINGKTLDNTKGNLRVTSNAINCRNSGPRRGRKYKGVFLLPSNRYAAKLWVAPKLLHLGVFDTEEKAARRVDAVTIEKFGTLVGLNFPEEI